MARSKNGEAIPPERRTAEAVAALHALRDNARSAGRLDVWLRARAVSGYIEGRRVVELAELLEVGRSTINDWLKWYAQEGVEGLQTAKPGKARPKLSVQQREALGAIVDAGPLEAGFHTGLWTGKMIAAVIQDRFGVSFHPQSVPRLLHDLGFSVQRPRKRLARADPAQQAKWVTETLPGIKKKPLTAVE